MNKKVIIALLSTSIFLSCHSNSGKQDNHLQEDSATVVSAPSFNADSAYQYISRQVAFGPRVPNTPEHERCAEYLQAELERHGATVTAQKGEVTAYDGTLLRITNLIGSYKAENPKRVLLFAHWDTRPWADHDTDASKHRTPILGANDGASGVGVLLEMARLIHAQAPEIGIDIIFFDAEDYGTPQWARESRNDEATWCLGTQYWARNPHVDGYNARYGILLDMVGGKNATFYQESLSREAAQWVVDKVWKKADSLGYGSFFIPEEGVPVTDDHLFVNRIANIPSIDIIPIDRENGGFGYFWHTMQDNMDVIDIRTLQAVGHTLMEIIYNER